MPKSLSIVRRVGNCRTGAVVLALGALFGCKPRAVTTQTPQVRVPPMPTEHQPERLAALSDLPAPWVARSEYSNLYDGLQLLVYATPGGAAPGPHAVRTRANTTPLLITLGDRSGSHGADTDRDGISDAAERALELDPNNADTDGDTIPDGFELFALQTLANAKDSDADGRDDNVELNLDDPSIYGDADGDGLSNAQETARLGSDPSAVDSDGDGFGDDVEFALSTAINDAAHPDRDADGDGELDAYETANGLDPNNTSSQDPSTHGDHLPDWLSRTGATMARVRGRAAAAVPAAPCTPPQDNNWGKSQG